ncbi:MAG TPA: hypothetical protein VI932_07670 [Bacteroidota bacterium]|nr:hypothetical protein [Bacteroidota bacterium]
MAAFLDVIGSFVLGGMILIMSTKLNFVMSDNSQQSNMELATQENCVVVSRMLEVDLSKIGYRSSSAAPIKIGDSTNIKFYADIDDNGTVDSVSYFTGPMTAGYASINPRHKLLYRSWNNTTIAMNVGLTRFKITYYDSVGAQAAQLNEIRSMKVSMDVESVLPSVDTVYSIVHWEQYINPKFFRYTFN